MATNIEIAAVGDILMWHEQIQSARVAGEPRYDFSLMFEQVAPYFHRADLVIGNLETTLSGRDKQYQRKNKLTGYPMFNCPIELAHALHKAGFDVVTTANNHCMDRGIVGLKHTIMMLNQEGLAHTGTFATKNDALRPLVMNVKGVRVGILAYTYGTNFLPVPKEHAYAVSLIRDAVMVRDVKRLKPLVDIILVAMHFGYEFHRQPSKRQQRLTRMLFQAGADVVLGAHPHVLQPAEAIRIEDDFGENKMRFVIYSLGNFISTRMMHDPLTEQSIILRIHVTKNEKNAHIHDVSVLPTIVKKVTQDSHTCFLVQPLPKSTRDVRLLEVRKHILKHVLHHGIQAS